MDVPQERHKRFHRGRTPALAQCGDGGQTDGQGVVPESGNDLPVGFGIPEIPEKIRRLDRQPDLLARSRLQQRGNRGGIVLIFYQVQRQTSYFFVSPVNQPNQFVRWEDPASQQSFVHPSDEGLGGRRPVLRIIGLFFAPNRLPVGLRGFHLNRCDIARI